MAVSLSVIAAKDSAGAAIAGGLQAQDKSGAGSGPFTLGQVLIDGLAGANMAAVTATNALKVDGSAVTQPVSLATLPVTNAGTFAVQATLAAETTKVIGTVNISAGQVAPTAALTAASAPASGLATLGQYNATNPAPTNTQSVALQLGPNGQLLVLQGGNPANYISGLTAQMTSTTSTAVTGVGAPGSGLRNYITQLTFSNAHATVGTEISLQDGSGGTSFYTVPAAPAYGGATLSFNPPLKQPTANTALFAVNLTTGAATKVSVSGYTGA